MTQLPPPDATQPLIELKNVVKTFKSPAGEFTALKNINLSFDRGEFTSIMGKSGSGKSTLINMITGIDHPSSGLVRVGDVQLMKKTEGQLAVWRGRTVGVVFQFFQLLPTLSVLENTLLPMDYCNMYAPAERELRAMQILQRLGLEGVADQLPAALSGGQQQIAAIARALANDPPILIADEPTGNLDTLSEKLILDIFEDLAAHGKTILIVTHDPVLARRSTRRVIISDGELVAEPVAAALPMLTHTQMLKISRLAVPRSYEPGDLLARQGAFDEALHILTRGSLEVLTTQRFRTPKVTGQIEAVSYFSKFDLLETPNCDLSFRASGSGPVEALVVTLEKFDQLTAETPAIEHALHHAALQRDPAFFPQPEARSFRRLFT